MKTKFFAVLACLTVGMIYVNDAKSIDCDMKILEETVEAVENTDKENITTPTEDNKIACALTLKFSIFFVQKPP